MDLILLLAVIWCAQAVAGLIGFGMAWSWDERPDDSLEMVGLAALLVLFGAGFLILAVAVAARFWERKL